jgi:hypothetical protein
MLEFFNKWIENRIVVYTDGNQFCKFRQSDFVSIC